MPTSILKKCLPEILPSIVNIVNKSFNDAEFPTVWKTATVRPLLKKCGLDPEVLKNYRPVSNIPFCAKLLEKVAIEQLDKYFTESSLYCKFQSAYRKNHCTESALLRVQNDILCSLDDHYDVILVMLDLSAAFDTIDHNILFSRLEHRFGIGGTALKWIMSYFSDRTQRVVIGDEKSDSSQLFYGVPQGSCFGPLLFTLYCSPLEEIIEKFSLKCMFYADDTQLYIRCVDVEASKNCIESCITEIRKWMAANRLVLNDSKTEVVHFHSKFRLSSFVSIDHISVGDDKVPPVECVRNLGFYFDSTASLSSHINNICRSASYGLYKIGRIRQFLDRTATEQLVHAFVTSRLDYCNSLLVHLPATLTKRLQHIQNSAARLVTRARKHEHITPILMSLHWLPLEQRTVYKTLVITFKALNGLAPIYITELLTVLSHSGSSRLTRSSCEIRLFEPRFRQEFYGRRAFSVAAPRLWNALPKSIRHAPSLTSFQSMLKTHLFRTAYH